MRLIKNKPDDPLAHKCGHGVSIRECQYQYCTARDLLKLAETQIELIKGALLNKEVPKIRAASKEIPEDNLKGLWKTVDEFFILIGEWESVKQVWYGRVLDTKGEVMAMAYFNSQGDEDPPNQGFGYLKKRAPENHMQGTCSREFWPPVGVEVK